MPTSLAQLRRFRAALGQLRQELGAHREECARLRTSGAWAALSPAAQEALHVRGAVLQAEYEALRAQFRVTLADYRASRAEPQ
jgi:hypothetical protein